MQELKELLARLEHDVFVGAIVVSRNGDITRAHFIGALAGRAAALTEAAEAAEAAD